MRFKNFVSRIVGGNCERTCRYKDTSVSGEAVHTCNARNNLFTEFETWPREARSHPDRLRRIMGVGAKCLPVLGMMTHRVFN